MNTEDTNILLTEEAKKEHYIYTLKKLVDENEDKEYDSLTGLMKRKAFNYYAYEMINSNKDKKFAIILLDIYRFKTVNEFFGREAGDKILIYISEIFKKYQKDYCVAAHLRADIFAMAIEFKSQEELISIADDISESILEHPFECRLMPAIGICVSQTNDEPISIMCDYANLALETIKGKVFNSYAFYDEKYRKKLLADKRIENDMVKALRTGQFDIYIQPKVDLKTGIVNGGEALVRWNHPTYGVMFPKDFLPIFEQNGFIIELDIYIWEKVFKLIRSWLDRGIKPVPLSMNLSRIHSRNLIFEDKLNYLSEKYNVAPGYVRIELTESSFMENEEQLFEVMQRMRSGGFTFSVDDFGTGYSAMALLKKQPIDEVKIDKEFISGFINQKKSRIILQHIIAMMTELDIEVIAEGVENKEQADFLFECGCKSAQGFMYHKPVSIQEFEELIVNKE